jgi:pyruvate/2-oxoglutarate dehydrogenase complex dihydrolipoamide acyltransferase (E2) component
MHSRINSECTLCRAAELRVATLTRVEVRLSRLDDHVEEATVSVLCRRPGERVRKGDDLVEFITDKATFAVAAPADGTVVSVEVGEDALVKVGDLLAVIETD